MRHFTAPDGARIAYRDEGSGRPLVLLHGLMAHSGFFRAQRELAEYFRLISIDLRAHGASGAADGVLTVEQLAGDVAGITEHLALEGAVGIGWSLGASVLWHLLTGPQARRFDGAVVVDMTARVMNCADWELGLSPEACDARTTAIADDFETFAVAAGQAIFAQPIAESRREDADWASFEFARNDPDKIRRLWVSLMREDFRPLLGRIEQPTLIVHGAHSHLYDAGTAEHLARVLRDAEIVRFAGSGHAPQIEEPDKFNAAIRAFAGRLDAAPRHHARQITN
ncbi:MAG TPA: alpha/beta hydrolase [Allosphingosinicella sp.]